MHESAGREDHTLAALEAERLAVARVGFDTDNRALVIDDRALDAMTGASQKSHILRARLRKGIDKRHARAEFQRARLQCDEHAVMWATSNPRQGSGMLRGVAEADALILLPEGEHVFAVGDIVEVLPLP